ALEEVGDVRVVNDLEQLLELVQAGSLGNPPSACATYRPDGFQSSVSGLYYQCYEPSIARALRNVHSEEALPLLARLLDSPDRETQDLAMGGLWLAALQCEPGTSSATCPGRSRTSQADEYLRHEPGPNSPELDRAERVRYWKRWFAQRSNGSGSQP